MRTSPDITARISSFLDLASGGTEGAIKGKARMLDINQVLVNEYQPGQGISVSSVYASSRVDNG